MFWEVLDWKRRLLVRLDRGVLSFDTKQVKSGAALEVVEQLINNQSKQEQK